MEEWVDLNNFPNHQISSYGRVRNKKTNYVLKPVSDRYEYLRVSIGSMDNVYIHKLVCEAFLGASEDKRLQVNHIDCNRQNNNVSNLEWCTASENIRWGVKVGNIKPQIASIKAIEVNKKPVCIVETGQIFDSVKDCADYFGVKPTNISRCLAGVRKGQRFHGCHIEYVKNKEVITK